MGIVTHIRDVTAHRVCNFAITRIASPEYTYSLTAFMHAGRMTMRSPNVHLLTDEERAEEPHPLTAAEAYQRTRCTCALCRRPWLP